MAMHRKRHGAIGAALALLTLLAALFCATAASPPAFQAAPSSTAADPHVAPRHETLDGASHDASFSAGKASCLKKVQPEQQHLRTGALLDRALPAQADEMTSPVPASGHTGVRYFEPNPSPPDLTELSVRRV
ncbi:hypothetical protein ACF08M_33950 [Streptomyces sp. NPDC015032]|uniref:hypothetical protein n=1 Tax=Streptomyces sp. NPDC015032 TaxID=3364937 RepID=UPI0036F5834D